MTLPRVLIVDDSPFSCTILADTLETLGYEVVGEAYNLEALLEAYSAQQPDIVTMDIAMPGADGFECSKTLLLRDPSAKIVLVSSMKDAESEAEARRTGVAGYIQKPIDPEVLKRVIDNVLAPDAVFESLDELSPDAFAESLAQNITRMTRATPVISTANEPETEHLSQGITAVIGIIGEYAGSMVLDLSVETAEAMAELMLRRRAKSRDEVLAMGAEFANVVAGVACSMLNKKNKAFGLRVAPPSVFFGATTEIVSPNLRLHSVYADSDFGCLYLSIGFRKGSVLWM